MNVKQIVIQHLKSIGADGLKTNGCWCNIDNLIACELFNPSLCVQAKMHNCLDDCDCDGTCYRPMETPTEEEETHL